MAIFTTSRKNSGSCGISLFPVSKQTVKVQFSLDVLENSFLLRNFFHTMRIYGDISMSQDKKLTQNKY